MPDCVGSLIRHATRVACLCLVVAAPAAAQQQMPLADPPTTATFMSRYDFHLSAAWLNANDQRFIWDTRWGGDFDLVDYALGRMTFLADYQAILGDEFRPFDPNQGNYTLEVAGSLRHGPNEFVGTLHHVSRHLGDRFKRQPIAWNQVDARYLRQFQVNGATVDLRAQVGKVIARANVDYSWITEVDATARHAVNPNVGVFGRAFGQLIGVHAEVYERDMQQGGRLEAGVRLTGRSGALELFAGYEAVIDGDPLDHETRHWAIAGFRLVTK